jgi:hypothetical protein
MYVSILIRYREDIVSNLSCVLPVFMNMGTTSLVESTVVSEPLPL